MLRRPPTLITLTQEDVAAYDEALATKRAQEAQKKATAVYGVDKAASHFIKGQTVDPNDELRPLPGERQRVPPRHNTTAPDQSDANSLNRNDFTSNTRSREERIGIGR